MLQSSGAILLDRFFCLFEFFLLLYLSFKIPWESTLRNVLVWLQGYRGEAWPTLQTQHVFLWETWSFWN